MKALSIKQPWTGLIAGGFKTIETRTWPTKYRGELLICASKKAVIGMGHEFYLHRLCSVNACTVCIVNLVDCVPMEPKHEKEAMCRVYVGAWAWILEEVQIVKQIPISGKLGIYEIPYLTLETLEL